MRAFALTIMFLLVLGRTAHADTASDAKKLTDAALSRYTDAEKTGSVFGQLWRVIDSSPHDNLVNAKDYVVSAKADVDKELKANQEVEAELKLDALKRSIADLDTEIEAYRKDMKSTLWKLYAGTALFIIAVFGGAIWAFIRRRGARR
jgi:hypothetical protein